MCASRKALAGSETLDRHFYCLSQQYCVLGMHTHELGIVCHHYYHYLACSDDTVIPHRDTVGNANKKHGHSYTSVHCQEILRTYVCTFKIGFEQGQGSHIHVQQSLSSEKVMLFS